MYLRGLISLPYANCFLQAFHTVSHTFLPDFRKIIRSERFHHLVQCPLECGHHQRDGAQNRSFLPTGIFSQQPIYLHFGIVPIIWAVTSIGPYATAHQDVRNGQGARCFGSRQRVVFRYGQAQSHLLFAHKRRRGRH